MIFLGSSLNYNYIDPDGGISVIQAYVTIIQWYTNVSPNASCIYKLN